MFKKSIALIVAFIIAAVVIGGCKNKTEEPVAPIDVEQAKKAAEKEITESNLDAEMEKLEKEIEADK